MVASVMNTFGESPRDPLEYLLADEDAFARETLASALAPPLRLPEPYICVTSTRDSSNRLSRAG